MLESRVIRSATATVFLFLVLPHSAHDTMAKNSFVVDFFAIEFPIVWRAEAARRVHKSFFGLLLRAREFGRTLFNGREPDRRLAIARNEDRLSGLFHFAHQPG